MSDSADRTKADYLQAKIETAFGDLPLDAVTRDFIYWRGSNASKLAVRFGALCGLRSEIAPCPLSARSGPLQSRDRDSCKVAQ